MNTTNDDRSFKFDCPHCSQSLEATGELIGKNLECPSCGKGFVVPTPATQSTPPQIPQQPIQSPLPPTKLATKKKFGCLATGLTVVGAAFMVLVGLSIFIAVSGAKAGRAAHEKRMEQEKIMEQEAVDLEKAHIEEFRKNRESILTTIRTAFADEKIIEALATSEKYLPADDKELNELHAKVLAEREKIRAESKAIADEVTRQANDLRKRNESIKSQFSAWDGSHDKLERYIKKHLNDPSSYEHVETRWLDKGDHILVITTFRGKNAFNATVKNTWVAKVSLAGELLEVTRD